MRMREGAAVILTVAAGAWVVYGSAPAARADRPATLEAMPVPAMVVEAAPARLVPLEDVGVRPLARRQGAVAVTAEDFEGDFPPEGWRTLDVRTQQGLEENYTWGNQDVLLAAPGQGRPGGGLKAPWAIGGGRLGANLAPGSNYDQPLFTDLIYGPFDATDFDGGVQVDFLVYLDGPIDANRPVVASFKVCGTTAIPTELRCWSLNYQSADGTDLRRRWLTLQTPLPFPLAARLSAVRIYFRAEDLTPSGTFTGSLIDNVRIEGLSSSVPTSTLEPGETPRATTRPNDTPVPEATALPATPDGSSRVYLPISANNIDKDIMAPTQPTALPGLVEVGFGTGVLPDGTLVGQATRFGRIFQLCSAQRWTGLPVDTVLSVQWYDWDAAHAAWQKIVLADGNEQLNPTTKTTATAGVIRECVTSSDNSPIEPGRLRVAVFLRGEAVAWADEVAEVTGQSGPAPVPTAVPTLPSNCQNPVVNGDFELGGTGWAGRAGDGHNLLISPGFDSQVAIGFGGYDNAQDILVSSGKIETLPIEDIEAVTVRFALGLLGNETRGNDDNADRFIVGVAGDTDTDFERLILSEDSAIEGALLPLGRWTALSVDMKTFWAKRDGFNSAQIFFGATTNASNPMTFALDNVVVEYCRKTGEIVRVPLRLTPGGIAPADLAAALESTRPSLPVEVERRSNAWTDRLVRPFHPAEGR